MGSRPGSDARGLLSRQVLIPISLYVSIELVKLGQVFFLHHDLDLYDEETDSPIQCRALNITEDLGQIQHIFSDKTGTLTENRMVFRRCTVMGREYPHQENGTRTPRAPTPRPQGITGFPRSGDRGRCPGSPQRPHGSVESSFRIPVGFLVTPVLFPSPVNFPFFTKAISDPRCGSSPVGLWCRLHTASLSIRTGVGTCPNHVPVRQQFKNFLGHLT